MTATIKPGTVIEFDGDRYKVVRLVRTYSKTTPRYSGDSNPIPAGTIVCDLSGGGINRRSFRPGTYRIVK